MKKLPRPNSHSPLRARAETRLRQQAKGNKGASRPRSAADTHRLLHELQVHQIELEMQNEELRRAQDKMEAGLEKYAELYDFAPVGYLTVNTQGAILEANLTVASLLGIPRAPLMKQRLRTLVALADRPIFDLFIPQVFKSTERQECDLQLQVKDKPPIDVCLRANHFQADTACRIAISDVTQHKQDENKVRISEIRYRRLFEAAQDGILLVDPDTHKITDANPFMTKLLDCERAQLVGKELFEIGLLKDKVASQEMFQKLTRNHEVRYENLPLASRSGRLMEVEAVASLYSEDGVPVIQCHIRDITLRQQAELAWRRLAVLTADNAAAKREITRRNLVEASLRASEQSQARLLTESRSLHGQLRLLTRQIITAQEEERKMISRELHDDVLQTLFGINVALAALNPKGSSLAPSVLRPRIARTQQMVKASLLAVRRFARNLRPLALDDYGLIPALQGYIKRLAKQKKLRIDLTTSGEIGLLDSIRTTVLFWVAREAITNVVRHARATVVRLHVSKTPHTVRMEVHDNGKSFPVQAALTLGKNQRLGLLGMRERVEMVDGTLEIKSAPGRGTLVRVEIPFTLEKAGK